MLGGLMIVFQQTADCETRISSKVDETAALRLAAEGYFGTDKKLGFLDYDSQSDSFFIFDGLSKPPAEGSFGFFAVNSWTGDVWNLWGCHRLFTPALRKSQAAIRRRFTAQEMKRYDRLRQLKPECIVED
ncbi:MAG: hypothetical protein ACREFH_02020 [Stellaceae bacterium]